MCVGGSFFWMFATGYERSSLYLRTLLIVSTFDNPNLLRWSKLICFCGEGKVQITGYMLLDLNGRGKGGESKKKITAYYI